MALRRTLVFAAALACLTSRAGAGDLNKGTAEVEADRLEVDHGTRSARFSGNVHAVWSNLELHCDEMIISYDTDGEIVALKARGKIAVTRGEARATAATAMLDARLGLLVLEGQPVLHQGGNRLEGKRITVHLADGRLEVNEARGTFRLGKETQR